MANFFSICQEILFSLSQFSILVYKLFKIKFCDKIGSLIELPFAPIAVVVVTDIWYLLIQIASDEEPAPLPPSPVPASTDIAPLPVEDSMPLLVPPHINDSGDSELELSTLLAEHSAMAPAVEDCVLPTVPSLSDMMSQSEFCGSIDSTDSSPGHGEGSLSTEKFNGEMNINVANVQIKQEVISLFVRFKSLQKYNYKECF